MPARRSFTKVYTFCILVPRLLRVRDPFGKLDEIEMEDKEPLNQIPVEETLNGLQYLRSGLQYLRSS